MSEAYVKEVKWCAVCQDEAIHIVEDNVTTCIDCNNTEVRSEES